MRSDSVLAVGVLVSACVPFAHADFTNFEGTQHILGSADDVVGSDFFEHEEAIPTGFHTDFFDNAYTPSEHTWAGVATLTDVGTDSIDLRGFVYGHTDLSDGFITALAEVTLTFTIEKKRLVIWDYLLLTDPGTFAGAFLTDPDGHDLLPGAYSLEPGEYTLHGFTGYTDLHVHGGDGTFSARFIMTLQQIPAPGCAALLGVAGLLLRRRRR